MSLTTTILMLIFGWLSVATAMLWGVLRIARRHHHAPPAPSGKAAKPARHHAAAH
ncbi:hypothetical protein HU715_004865 [Pseudomonas sp. SWRI12]|uniref:Uncharacterized protein n=1 Tax=Pseudomonas zanjanensis TaxID=2745496 RepID=A0A923FHV0_9PSED|nr:MULTISPECIES: hypothetical protein [Pseudomonas]MBC3382657.1 hypothetical protein [Pseudomonas sp. SWRI179]MBV4494681.1 hypothetical protein [Pseudomonas zanjanensis]MCM2462193.1 hypothetical protein [Pseudomonas sp. CG7]